MVDLNALLRDQDHWIPAHIELVEQSGPVAPRQRYETRIEVTAAPDGPVRWSYRDIGQWDGDTPARNTDHTGELSTEAYEALWRTLLQAEVLALSADFVGEHRQRPTAPLCHFELTLGPTRVRIDYLPSQVHSFAFFKYRAILHAVKALRAHLP